jgi:hypothetical protein
MFEKEQGIINLVIVRLDKSTFAEFDYDTLHQKVSGEMTPFSLSEPDETFSSMTYAQVMLAEKFSGGCISKYMFTLGKANDDFDIRTILDKSAQNRNDYLTAIVNNLMTLLYDYS